jgi:16S rRNA processing protein RimM
MQLEYLTVGVITKAHGLRGEVRVLSRTDFPDHRFRVGAKLWLREPRKTPIRELEIRSARPHKQFWLLAFTGFPSINDVEGWRGFELCVPESDRVPLPEGTYYIHQLVGLKVYSDDGRYVGELTEVLTPGANDVYVVRGPLQKQDVLLPAISECIQEVDLSKGTMTVHLMPGLLEDDAEDDRRRGRRTPRE